jgi:DNA invertase Pin-like site-specific DNA recombinase
MSFELQLAPRVRAAQYLRMSTEHQRYSLDNQTAAIAEYAEARGYVITQTYKDAGKSGVSLRGRQGLRSLISDVMAGGVDFSTILVLDVSRWGRFQDTDEPAHYEFLCRSAGVNVQYVGELFENDGSMVSAILKNMKRVMAGEYSRELSVKISRAQMRQARLGFKQGGNIPYGIRRLLVDEDREPRFYLAPGQRKGLNTDRILFAPGTAEEIRVVRRIFKMFVDRRISMLSIARILNEEGIPSTGGEDWSASRVRTVLSSELMIGYYVFNRTSRRLHRPLSQNPEERWIRVRVMDRPSGVGLQAGLLLRQARDAEKSEAALSGEEAPIGRGDRRLSVHTLCSVICSALRVAASRLRTGGLRGQPNAPKQAAVLLRRSVAGGHSAQP